MKKREKWENPRRKNWAHGNAKDKKRVLLEKISGWSSEN
jgi:hypothetical protein